MTLNTDLDQSIKYLCLDCAKLYPCSTNNGKTVPVKPSRCAKCRSPRLRMHPELETLHIAHVDCDSFYASVEKLDHPELASKAVAVGNRERGVVAACCYIARSYGIKSAMPMFQILKLCPDIVIMPARMERYQEIGLQIRDLFKQTTPAIEPLSIDEAFLDLSGLGSLTGKKPCEILAELIIRIKSETDIQVSAGLSANKFLAKTASDLEKPKGYSIIGQEEAQEFLSKRPIESMFGVGKSMANKLHSIGVQTIGDLTRYEHDALIKQFGVYGQSLYYFARGLDTRPVASSEKQKSIGKEHSYGQNIIDIKILDKHLYFTATEVTDTLKAQNLVAAIITLKLRDNKGKAITRSTTLTTPTNLCNIVYKALRPILYRTVDGYTPYRLLGISTTNLTPFNGMDYMDLGDPNHLKNATKERLIDKINEKVGKKIIITGKDIL